jgi:hypothetical protein
MSEYAKKPNMISRKARVFIIAGIAGLENGIGSQFVGLTAARTTAFGNQRRSKSSAAGSPST